VSCTAASITWSGLKGGRAGARTCVYPSRFAHVAGRSGWSLTCRCTMMVRAGPKNLPYEADCAMQFHEYRTIRNQTLAVAKDHPEQDRMFERIKQMSSAQYRNIWIDDAKHGKLDHRLGPSTALTALGEGLWVDEQRPYYNVWPIAVELARAVKLTLPFKSIGIPFHAMLLRFAKGHEPCGIPVAMLCWPRDQPAIHVVAYGGQEWHQISLAYHYNPDEQVEEWLNRAVAEGPLAKAEALRAVEELRNSILPDGDVPSLMGDGGSAVPELLIRLCVFIGLLASDCDFITPIVLAKDRQEYESTDDPDTKKWLEDRAARRAGRGFDVAKKLQIEKEKSPHWRNPHLCLFWTGLERKKPVIQMRSGAVVQRVSMAEVPTGYLGPETEADNVVPSTTTPRESISKTRRFQILKRDNYRCQLCGKSADDAVKLHVDHRLAVAKGGSSEDDNLWTLCEQCNLGKSDETL